MPRFTCEFSTEHATWIVWDYGEFLAGCENEHAARIICLALESYFAAAWMWGRFVAGMPKIHLRAN